MLFGLFDVRVKHEKTKKIVICIFFRTLFSFNPVPYFKQTRYAGDKNIESYSNKTKHNDFIQIKIKIKQMTTEREARWPKKESEAM